MFPVLRPGQIFTPLFSSRFQIKIQTCNSIDDTNFHTNNKKAFSHPFHAVSLQKNFKEQQHQTFRMHFYVTQHETVPNPRILTKENAQTGRLH